MTTEARRAEIRGMILFLLEQEYYTTDGKSISFGTLRQALSNLGMPLFEHELSGYIKYLNDCKYITTTTFKERLIYLQIAPDGLRLQAGLVKDEMVLVRPYTGGR